MTICATCAILSIDADYFPAFQKQVASKNYLQTPGTIIESTVKYYERTRPSRRDSVAVIRYTFLLEKGLYTCDRFKYSGPRPSAATIVKRMPKGATVPVYYNPQNPGDAVLMRGVNDKDWIDFWIIVGLNLLVLCGWWAGLFYRRRKPAELGTAHPR